MHNAKLQHAKTLSLSQIGLFIVFGSLVIFVVSLTFAALSGEVWEVSLRIAAGSMLEAVLSSTVVAVGTRLISGKFDPFAVIIGSGMASAAATQAAHDGRWVSATLGVLVSSLVVGIALGIAGPFWPLSGRTAQPSPGASDEG